MTKETPVYITPPGTPQTAYETAIEVYKSGIGSLYQKVLKNSGDPQNSSEIGYKYENTIFRILPVVTREQIILQDLAKKISKDTSTTSHIHKDIKEVNPIVKKLFSVGVEYYPHLPEIIPYEEGFGDMEINIDTKCMSYNGFIKKFTKTSGSTWPAFLYFATHPRRVIPHHVIKNIAQKNNTNSSASDIINSLKIRMRTLMMGKARFVRINDDIEPFIKDSETNNWYFTAGKVKIIDLEGNEFWFGSRPNAQRVKKRFHTNWKYTNPRLPSPSDLGGEYEDAGRSELPEN